MAVVSSGSSGSSGSSRTASEQDWLRVRRYLQARRHDLALGASRCYPGTAKLAGTPLLAGALRQPAAPMPLASIDLRWAPHADARATAWAESPAVRLLPARVDGMRYRCYSEAVSELASPALFRNRPTYRLLEADLSAPRGRLCFGLGSYFDGIDTGEAAAHEYAAVRLGAAPGGLRAAIGDPCDLTRRPANVAISTLTVRIDRRSGAASFLLHWRDPAKVGHAGGLYHVVPAGVFQPASSAPWHVANDLSLWRCMIREFAEELTGQPEDHGSERAVIDYRGWSFARRMTEALEDGRIRVYCLGIGVDPLTFATDLLTAAVIDAVVFAELFDDHAHGNAEGQVLEALPFEEAVIERFASDRPVQAAGAALLRLAWEHRAVLAG